MKKLLPTILLAFVALASTNIQAQFQNDAGIVSVAMNDIYTAGSAQHNVDITFTNAGTNNINPLTFNWTADGGVTVNSWTVPFTFAPGSQLTLTHINKVSFSNPGTYTEMKVWTSNPNNMTDPNSSNDTLIKQIFVNNGNSVSRNVFFEEFTTAVCQFCPQGTVVLDNIMGQDPTVIGVGVHAGFGTDAMTIPEHSMLASAFTTSAPSGVVDRTRFSGTSNVAIGTNQWGSFVNLRKTVPAYVDLTINGTIVSGGTANITVTANFSDFPLPGDIRMGVYIVEDSVTGSGSGYNQINAYNNSAGHPYQGAGNPIIGFHHRNVVRKVLPAGTPWGDATIIPSNPAAGSAHSKNYNFILHPNWDLTQVQIVAFVAYYGSSKNEREIMNAGSIRLLDMVTEISEEKLDLNSISVYPNPSTNVANLKFKLSQNENVELTILDITGKQISFENYGVLSAGNQLLQINTGSFPNGFYFAQLKIGNQQVIKKIAVNN